MIKDFRSTNFARLWDLLTRGVVPGGAGGATTPPDFGRSVNPNSTKGTDYAHLITTGTPRFSDLPTALFLVSFWLRHLCNTPWNLRK